jgi:hypothetical protein
VLEVRKRLTTIRTHGAALDAAKMARALDHWLRVDPEMSVALPALLRHIADALAANRSEFGASILHDVSSKRRPRM